MSSPLTAPSRRSVVRAAAWTAPAVSIAVAAPAYANTSPGTGAGPVNCSLANVSGTLDWDATTGVSFSRPTDRLSASATYTKADADALTLTVSTRYYEQMKVGSEFGANTNFDRPSRIGGLDIGGLMLHQSNHRAKPLKINGQADPNARRTDRGEYIFTFDRAVKNLAFTITDIDSAAGDFRDALELTSGFSVLSRATRIVGSGTATDPFRSSEASTGADNVTSGIGNIRVQYAAAITSFAITYWNIQDDYTTDTDQAAFISDLTFDYAPETGCAVK